MLAANAHLAPGLRRRASRASPARCRPAAPPTGWPRSWASPCYETPTGWKFFGNLLDAGMATICGEESAGTGSNHVREKDGLWAVLLWLNILAGAASSRRSTSSASTGPTYGRNYYSRHDYEEVDAAAANGLMDASARPARRPCPARSSAAGTVAAADDFAYTDPVDGSVSKQPGHPHPVRRRLAHRVPPLRHRHRRRHAARLPRALRARPQAPRPGHADRRWPT